jgi:hypothetical protein
MRGLITFLGVVAAVPLLVVACGGDSDDGGSTGGTGGGLLGGAGGMSGSGGSTGGTSGSGGSGGATGGTGGTITNECSPIPSQTAGSGGTDGGGVDSGVDASSGGSPADASADGAATDGGPAADATTDGATSDGAISDGGASDAGLPTIQCGSNSCTGFSAGGLLTVNPCCTPDGCGLNIESSVSGLLGITAGCYGVGQAGKADTACPEYSVANPLGGTIEFPGCCRPGGECGFAIDTSSFGGPNLGCVPQECNGGPAKTCTP